VILNVPRPERRTLKQSVLKHLLEAIFNCLDRSALLCALGLAKSTTQLLAGGANSWIRLEAVEEATTTQSMPQPAAPSQHLVQDGGTSIGLLILGQHLMRLQMAFQPKFKHVVTKLPQEDSG
jgi:hypothetical protein